MITFPQVVKVSPLTCVFKQRAIDSESCVRAVIVCTVSSDVRTLGFFEMEENVTSTSELKGVFVPIISKIIITEYKNVCTVAVRCAAKGFKNT